MYIIKCCVNRAHSIGFPSDIVSVCTQANQWPGWSASLTPSTQTIRLAQTFMDKQGTTYIAVIPTNCVFFQVETNTLQFRPSWDSTDITTVFKWGD